LGKIVFERKLKNGHRANIKYHISEYC